MDSHRSVGCLRLWLTRSEKDSAQRKIRQSKPLICTPWEPSTRVACTCVSLRDWRDISELKQSRRRWEQERHKFAYLTMKNRYGSFARFARAFFIFGRSLSTKWNDLFCTCADDVSTWLQIFSLVFMSLKRWFQFNSRILRTHFARIMT